MRSKLLLFPAAIVASVAAVQPAVAGAQYLTAEQAMALLYPAKGITFTEDFRLLTDKQMRDIREFSGIELRDRKVRAWRVSNGDWLFVDHVLGKDDTVYYALALSPKGEVKGIEVMECWELYSKIRLPEWRDQFKGRKDGELRVKGDVETITGVTLSSKHITEGVIRMLATFTLVFSDAAAQGG